MAHFVTVMAPWLQLKALSLPTLSYISLILPMPLNEDKQETVALILGSLENFQLYLLNEVPLRVYIAMHMRYWATMRAVTLSVMVMIKEKTVRHTSLSAH